MITPNKFITFKQSILGKIHLLCRSGRSIGLHDLYELNKENFGGIDEFIYALDVLFVLDRISVDLDTGVVNYAS
jgi:hypothetical protein